MQVIKRNGDTQKISFDKISTRIQYLIDGVEYENQIGKKLNIDAIEIAKDVCSQIKNNISTSQLDEYAAEISAYRISEHPDYDVLAARIIISNNHKNNKKYEKFSDMMNFLTNNNNMSDTFINTVNQHSDILNKIVSESHILDYTYLTYFGYKTLEKSYLAKFQGIYERPQHMFMRVALDINRNNINDAITCYKYMQNFYFTHATPTLFNSGHKFNQYSSCFLLGIDDSLQSMYKILNKSAHISKWAGGIGIWFSKIRAQGSIIKSTQGESGGIVPLLKVFNEFARHVNQGGLRRGSVACYIEPWHADIWDFLQLKRIVGKEEDRARDLFYALYIPDLFMQRVISALETNDKTIMWSLFCPAECPGLADVYGDKFDTLYLNYEKQGKYKSQVPIIKLWYHILDSQLESSMPYMLYKDHINHKSNQKNIGTIRSSNLCVAADTHILTINGEIQIQDLNERVVTIWNGYEWSDVFVKKTGVNQKVIRICFSNNRYIDATPYHLFYIKQQKHQSSIDYNNNNLCDKSFDNSNETEICVRTNDLKIGDRIINYTTYNLNNIDVHDNIVVTDIVHLPELVTTYCFTEPLRNKGIFNGVLAGNCAEITQYSNPDEFAICNLANLSLSRFVDGNMRFNYDLLQQITDIIVKNMNNIINQNFYTCKEAMQSNLKHRPIAIGVQGLAETFFKLRLPYESETAQATNIQIFETILYGALTASCKISQQRRNVLIKLFNNLSEHDIDKIKLISSEMMHIWFKQQNYKENCHDNELISVANSNLHNNITYKNHQQEISKYFSNSVIQNNIIDAQIHIFELQFLDLNLNNTHLGAYSSFYGSPASQGILQFDMWPNAKLSGTLDWTSLKQMIIVHGLANSLLTSLMPTASTAQIMGNTEAFEPITSNIYSRSVLSGNFMIVNKFLQQDLINLGLWNLELKNKIIENRGSIANITNIPDNLKAIYKTAWDISNKKYIDMSAQRGAFIDQSQSFNLFIAEPNYELLTKCHIYGWKSGLKTGMYYLRRKPVVNAQQFTIQVKTDNKLDKLNNQSESNNTSENKTNNVQDDAANQENIEPMMCYIGCTSCQ